MITLQILNVNNIFALFRSSRHFENFTNYLNSKHKNIKFIYAKESNNSMRFLDVLISRSENCFKTSVYHRPTFSGVSSKIDLIFTCYLELSMLFRTFLIVSDFSRFHTGFSHLKEIFKKDAFPIKLVDNCIKAFLNKKFLHAPVALTVEKKELCIAIPYLGNLSVVIKIRLQNSINKNLPFCKIKVIFKSTTRHSKFFRFKNKVPLNLYLNVVSCARCNATYYSESCRHLNSRVGKHSGVSPLTRKKWKAKQLLIKCSFPIT